MELNLTPKEVESVGLNRYLYGNKRIMKAISIAIIVAMGIAAVTAVLDYSIVVSRVAVAVMLLGFGPTAYVLYKGTKAGKALRREWEQSILSD